MSTDSTQPAEENIETVVKAAPIAPAKKMPYRPRVSAGWWLPGIAEYKVSQWLQQLTAVNALEASRRKLTEPQIRKEALSLKYRAKSGEPASSLLPETYSLVREAGYRALNMRHYDVQILGGTALFHGCITRCRRAKARR